MNSRIPRRRLLKSLGLALCSPLLSQFAFASESEWVLGFGSCMDLRKNQNFWESLNSRSFSHFAFLGDNLYPERDTLGELEKAYQKLSLSEGLAAFKNKVDISAIWDDHDFGADNADSTLPFRRESFSLFRNFWKQDYASEDDGVYSSTMFEHQGRKIHLIMTDTRYHRTAFGATSGEPFEPGDTKEFAGEALLLGNRQWEWLETQLDVPADLKIIGSSIQVLSSDHRFEKWMNYPAEHQRLVKALGRISSPSLILSGDRHLHEISRTQLVSGRTIYDFTSSGFNKAEGLSRFEKNRLRVQRSLEDGFGELRLKWIDGIPLVSMSMIDKNGVVRFTHSDYLV